MKTHSFIITAEYIAIVATLVGATIALISNQILYAIVPMTLAVILNFLRSQNFERSIQTSSGASNTDMETEVKHLKEMVSALTYRLLSDGVISGREPSTQEEGIGDVIREYIKDKTERRQTSW